MAKPQIRLKGFEGEWKLSLMSELTTSFSYGINAAAIQYDGIHKYLRITDINDSSNEFDQSNLTSPNAEESKLAPFYLKEGDITFARTGASVGKSYIYNPNDGNVIFAGFLIRVILKDRVNPFFVYLNTLTKKYRKHVTLVSQRSGQPGMNPKEFGEFRFYISPNPKEQRAIGDYFKSLDSMLQSTTKKIESLKQMKQACLVSMFPHAGETTPRVRFKGFEGEWKCLPMSEIFIERHDISTITDNLPQLSFTIEEGVIRPEDRKTNKRDFLIKDKTNKRYLVTCMDDIIYNPANVIYGAIHKNSLCDGVVSPIYKIFYTLQDPSFMECVVRRPEFIKEMTIYMEGTVQKLRTLKPEAFLKMSAYIAPSLEEQKKIGDYFRSLDKQISLQKQRLEKLKQIKAACLDKMFV